MLENRVYNEGQYQGKDDDFWMTSNDVVPQTNLGSAVNGGEAIPARDLGNSLKASSSFHPVQHQKYNLWLNDDKNTDFFNKTPRYLKKMEQGNNYQPKVKGSRLMRGVVKRKRKPN